jgi:hypothetical protein
MVGRFLEHPYACSDPARTVRLRTVLPRTVRPRTAAKLPRRLSLRGNLLRQSIGRGVKCVLVGPLLRAL